MNYEINTLHELTMEILKIKYDLKKLSIGEIYFSYSQIYDELNTLYKTNRKKGMKVFGQSK